MLLGQDIAEYGGAFKITEGFVENGWVTGGEPSGHILTLDKSTTGDAIIAALQNEINQELEKDLVIDDTANLGKSVRVKDANGRYIEFCKSTFPYHFDLSNLKIVVDCANGAAYSVGPSVFRELGAKVIPLFNEPDGLNINENCGSTHPEFLQKAIVDHQADLGIAFDGDAYLS